jgi:hypothetical protein
VLEQDIFQWQENTSRYDKEKLLDKYPSICILRLIERNLSFKISKRVKYLYCVLLIEFYEPKEKSFGFGVNFTGTDF